MKHMNEEITWEDALLQLEQELPFFRVMGYRVSI